MRIAIVLEALTGSFITDMDKAGKEAKKQAEKMRKDWEAAGKAIGIFAAGAVTALAVLTKSQINAADQLAKMSQKVGVSVETLSTLKYAADQSGVSVETLQSSLVRLTKNASDAAKGTGEAIQGFDALGISVATADGKLKSSDALLIEIAEKFASFEDGANKTALAVNLFGKSGAELIPMLNAGASGIDELRQRARDLGLELDTNTAKQAEQFNDLLADAADLAKGFGNDLAKALLPALVSLAEVFVDNGIEGRKASGAVEMVSGAIKTTAGVALAGVAQVQKFGAILGMVAAQVDVFFTTIGKNFDAFQQYQQDVFDIGPIDAFVKFTETGFGNVSVALDHASGNMDALKLSFSDIDDDATKKIAALNATLSSTGSAAEDAAAGIAPMLKDVKKDAAEADRIAKQNAKSQAAYNFELDRWAAELLPEAERAAAQYNTQVQELIADQKAGKLTADQMARALGILGTEYQRNAQQIAKNQDVLGRIKQSYAEQAGAIGLTGRELAGYMASLEAARDAQATFGDELANMPGYLEEVQQAAKDGAVELYDMQREALDLESILSNFENFGMSGLVRDIERVKQALIEAQAATGDAFDPKLVAALRHELGSLQQAALEYATGALGEGISSLKSMASEGSKAYAALEVAQTALNLATAIGAIANQGMGDPYTAFARIAAMAAMMSQLVDGIGSLAGGGGVSAGSSAYRQERQGTGTVLGDSAAKSESIARAVEITADATSELVGINRGMLNALNAMQEGISGASSRVAGTEFGEIGLSGGFGDKINLIPAMDLFGLGTKIINSIFGGKQELIDQGILIVGGTLSGMIDNIMASAFQTIKTDGGWFRSDKVKDALQDLGDDATRQLQLVLASMADAVRAGAEALGLNMEEVNRAIEQYQIAEIRISTQGLTGEEAQKELEAVFSKIFDGLAGSIVPFIGQFQRVGEGLGETLVRVATGVQVTQEAIKQLGFALDEASPEKFAQASEGLIELVGGIDEFISGMSTFVNNFATDEHKFAVAQEALNSAFEQAGLVVPATRDAMWDLMQSLDATSESGREQIATLLRLAGVSDDYYGMLEDHADKLESIISDIEAGAWQQYLDGLEDGQRAIVELTRYYDDWIASATEAGATSAQLAEIEEQRAVAMGRLLEAQAKELAGMLDDARFEDALAGMSDFDASVARMNKTWEASIARMIEIGASEEELAEMRELQANATRRLAEAEAERIDADIFAGAWAQYLDGLTDAQRAIAESTRYYDDWIASATEAGATSAQLAEIEEQRAVAMGRLLEAQAEAQAQAERDYQAVAQRIADQLAVAQGASSYRQELVRIQQEYDDNVKTLNSAARAAGRAEAAERDLANALQVATLARAKAVAQLEEEARRLAGELYGTPMSLLDAQIAALQEQESAASAAIGSLGDAMSEAARAAAEAMGLLLGSYSPLRASDKLPIALEALRRGETDANTVLGIARDVYSSGAAYNRIFEQVQAIVASQRATEIGGGGRDAISAAMQRLLDERDALLAEQEAANRFGQASQLAELIAELAGVRGEGFDAVADSLGFGLDQLAADLRLANTDALSEYLTALQADQLSLAEIFAVPTVGDELIASAIFDLGEKVAQGWNDGEPITNLDADPIPVVVTDSESQRAEENTALLRDVRDLLTRLIEPATATATATEATADGVALLREAIEAGSLDAIVDGRRIG